MQSCCFFVFFSPDLFMKISNFKNCPYDFHEILHSHSTPKGAPACAKASKSSQRHQKMCKGIKIKAADNNSILVRWNKRVVIIHSYADVIEMKRANVRNCAFVAPSY